MSVPIIYVELTDKESTFYDATSGASIVRDRVAKVPQNAAISSAIRNGQLTKLDPKWGEAKFVEQNPELQTNEGEEIVAETEAVSELEGATNEDGEPAESSEDTATDAESEEEAEEAVTKPTNNTHSPKRRRGGK